MCCSFLVIEESLYPLIMKRWHMLLFFVTLGQPWLASIRSSQRGRPETAMGGLLLPSLHRSFSLMPGGGFIGHLGGDVGGPPQCSSSTPSDSSSGMSGGSSSSSSDTDGGGFIRWLPVRLLGLQWWMPPCKAVSSSIWIGSRFQLFSRITKGAHVHFRLKS
jgi:hypothetical protein